MTYGKVTASPNQEFLSSYLMSLELRGFVAWISSVAEGAFAKFTPFGVDKSDNGKEVTCWIASEVGKVCIFLFTVM